MTSETVTDQGMVSVCKNGKWGYANTEGKVVISLMYDAAYDFKGGQAMVVRGEDRFYISNSGQRIS